MKFEQALAALREGKTVYTKLYGENLYYRVETLTQQTEKSFFVVMEQSRNLNFPDGEVFIPDAISFGSLMSNHWEIVDG